MFLHAVSAGKSVHLLLMHTQMV